ncbi:hypothetical protein ACFOOP_13435 [Marinicaulis aureus]|uniref:BPP domain-containing protein n=1 Tax=Hyphococcus aureus TaxID=2666033 RepID=A0ABW1L296_9PROT
MRLSAACLILLTFIAACDRQAKDGAPAPSGITELDEAPVSDELPGLPAAATGIAFWRHPTLSFNSTMIVATSAGVSSYSMEDGNEVSRIDGFDADGLAVSYIGKGPQAAGFIAFLDASDNAFRFYGVDNNSRAFLPLEGGPAIRGAVRSFCLGRAMDASVPSLFVIQKGKVQVFNLAAADGGISAENAATLDTPDNLVSCAVDIDGSLLVAAEDGDIYRLSGENAFAAPIAQASVSLPEDLAVIASADENDLTAVTAEILLVDLSNGAIHVFDRVNGKAHGAVKLTATDSMPGVDNAEVFAITGANFGGLYRNGVIAFGVANGEDGPVIRIAPVSSLKNALSMPVREPVSPRGEAQQAADEGLIIPINIDQE